MDVAIMIEGQNGLSWARWRRLGRAVEDLGFAGLFRSDHFTNASPPDKDSLELWTSLTWLADNTERIVFGPLVTPASFRDPVFTARTGKDVNALSDGRLVLGVGAGWQDREHEMFGYELLEGGGRFDRFEEALEVITRLLRDDERVDFDGQYYTLDDAVLLPRPEPGPPPVLVGGNGRNRTLPLAATYADEWNGVFIDIETWAELNDRLTALLEARDRDPSSVRRSLMTQVVFGRTQAELAAQLDGREAEALRERGLIVGTCDAVRDQLGTLAEAGLDGVMLQWLALDDLDRLEALATCLNDAF